MLQLKKFAWKDDKRREGRIHDKEEKAVAEQAVDPQTKVLLFKMINNGILENINGVISTGKEAVILHAEGGPGTLQNRFLRTRVLLPWKIRTEMRKRASFFLGPEPEAVMGKKPAGATDFEVEPMNIPKECVVKVFKVSVMSV